MLLMVIASCLGSSNEIIMTREKCIITVSNAPKCKTMMPVSRQYVHRYSCVGNSIVCWYILFG